MAKRIRENLIITCLVCIASYWYIFFIRVFETADISFHVPLNEFILLVTISLFTLLLTWIMKRVLEKITPLKPYSATRFILSAISSLAVVFFLILFIQIFTTPEIGGRAILHFNQVIEIFVLTNFQVLIVLIYLGFQSIKDYNRNRVELEESRRQQLEYRIRLYQQRLDPHFLFNNLNVLSALIESEKDNAQIYLKKFSEIYQYVVQTQKEELVPLKQELDHVRNYLYLIKKRFSNAYSFEFNVDEQLFFIIPNAVQIALENVIKHNSGNNQSPLLTKIYTGDNCIVVENQKREKAGKVRSHQTGLDNLNKLCEIILGRPLAIDETGNVFTLSIPIIEQKNEYSDYRR